MGKKDPTMPHIIRMEDRKTYICYAYMGPFEDSQIAKQLLSGWGFQPRSSKDTQIWLWEGRRGEIKFLYKGQEATPNSLRAIVLPVFTAEEIEFKSTVMMVREEL